MLLIQKGTIITMEGDGEIRADLLIKNGKIKRIEKNITREENMKIIDATGLYVYPGFIDAHSHIGLSEERNRHRGCLPH